MARILKWILYLSIALNVGSEIISGSGLIPLKSGILRFLTACEKKKKNLEILRYLCLDLEFLRLLSK